LQVAPDSSLEDIVLAYERQIARYDPASVKDLGEDFVILAAARRTALEEAFAVLRDPHKRFRYDHTVGLAGTEATVRQSLSHREVLGGVGSLFLGLLVLAALWSAVGSKGPPGPVVTEVRYPATPFNCARSMEASSIWQLSVAR
jgi:curved DNA-binding protein CbpA